MAGPTTLEHFTERRALYRTWQIAENDARLHAFMMNIPGYSEKYFGHRNVMAQLRRTRPTRYYNEPEDLS